MALELTGAMEVLLAEFLETEKPKAREQWYVSLAGLVRRILKWFDEQDLEPCEIGIVEAVRCGASIAERITRHGTAVTGGTAAKYMTAAIHLFDHLVRTQRRTTNPFREIGWPRTGNHITKNVLTEAQMGRLLSELCKFDEPKNPRERKRRYRMHVISEFMYSTGMRISEVASLEPEDLELDRRLVHLKEGKGGRARTAFLTGYAASVMERYVKTGRDILMDDNYTRPRTNKLFPTKFHTLIMSVNDALAKTCKALDLPVISSHSFRHSLGTHLLRAGCDMRYIQAILGHDRLGSTAMYTRVDKDDLKRALDEFHPRKWNKRGEE